MKVLFFLRYPLKYLEKLSSSVVSNLFFALMYKYQRSWAPPPFLEVVAAAPVTRSGFISFPESSPAIRHEVLTAGFSSRDLHAAVAFDIS